MSLVSMVLSLSRERVRVISRLIGSSPNTSRNTQHDKTCTASDGIVHTDAAVTTYKVR